MEMLDRTLGSVPGYVHRDLLDATPANVEEWLDSFLGVAPPVYRQLSTKITRDRWFEDATISKELQAYCDAKSETKRYNPTIRLCHRILALARAAMTGDELGLPLADERKSFPVDDVYFMGGSERPIGTAIEQGSIAIKRKPGIILLRERSVPPADKRFSWTDILTWFELKFVNVLADKLKEERASRGALRLGEGSEGQTSSDGHIKVRAHVFVLRDCILIGFLQDCPSQQ